MTHRHAVDDTDTPTAVTERMPDPRLKSRRANQSVVAYTNFAIAAALGAWWVLDSEAGSTMLVHPAWPIAVVLYFSTSMLWLLTAALRDYTDRRATVTEQLLRNWMVYKHEETSASIRDAVAQGSRDTWVMAQGLIEGLSEEVRRNRSQILVQRNDLAAGMLALESVMPELLGFKEWQGYARAMRDVAEGKVHIDVQDLGGGQRARLYSLPDHGGRAAGRVASASVQEYSTRDLG